MKEDISASVVAYTLFIAVLVIAIAPLLFSLSYNLLIIILGFATKLTAATSRVESLPFAFTGVTVDPNNFRYFSIAAISVISFFSSLIVSIVEKGSIKSGLKYIPIFLASSLVMYFVFMGLLSLVFRNITL